MKKIVVDYAILILSRSFRFVDKVLVDLHIIRPKVIIYMDGGICSQMAMYLRGQHFANSYFRIYYDTMWYTYCGKDIFGNQPRIFELTTMFPNLKFKALSPLQSNIYRRFFKYEREGGALLPAEDIKYTTYFYGYFDMDGEEYNNLFCKHFNTKTMCKNSKLLSKENYTTHCAVHVRRGDLADYENQWYKPVPADYFITSINEVAEKYPNTKFYFFSDGMEWVEENICSKITFPYELVQGNKPYEDLMLISQCDVVIASQGSFGRVGAKLGNRELIIPKN